MNSDQTQPTATRDPRPWKRRILSIAVIGAVGIVGAELTARAVSSLFRQRMMTYDTVVGWRPVPGSRVIDDAGYGSYRVAINSRGLRDSEHRFQKPAGQYRVVVLGDSITFGYGGVEQHDVFTEILEQRLPGVEFINLGVPCFSTDQEYLYLKEYGLRYNPDLVLLSMYQDDFFPTFQSFIPVADRPKGYLRTNSDELNFQAATFPWQYLLAEHSVLVGYAESRFKFVRHCDRLPAGDHSSNLDAKTRSFKLLLAAMRDLCRSRDVEFAIVLQPGFMLAREDDHTRRIAGEFAIEQQVDLLDLNDAPPFQAADAAARYGVGDNIHLNRVAHHLIADLLQEFLAQTYTEQNVFDPNSVNAVISEAGIRE